MTRRLVILLACVLVLLLAGFSTGSPVFLAPAALLVLTAVWAAVSSRWAARTVRVTSALRPERVPRGGSACLDVRVLCTCPLPVAPVAVTAETAPGAPPAVLEVPAGRGAPPVSLPLAAAHAGVSRPGVTACEVSDLFGLTRRRVPVAEDRPELLVEPQTFDVAPLTFAPAETGLGTMARATEDVSDPADVRGWQPGDPLKKLHWKLSARRREPVVRRFEEPALPETLVLMDCSRPASGGREDGAALVRDALLETAASVFAAQPEDRVVRLPLYGGHPVELQQAMGLPLVLENLARAELTDPERFDRVLLQETRRLRTVGATVVITCRLSGAVVETLCRMRRMGPTLRLYLVTFRPDAPEWMPFISRLLDAEVEVSYVKPDA